MFLVIFVAVATHGYFSSQIKKGEQGTTGAGVRGKLRTRADMEFLSSTESYKLEGKFNNFLFLKRCFTKLLEGCFISFAKNSNREFIWFLQMPLIMSSI
jgi:hypothetical protein